MNYFIVGLTTLVAIFTGLYWWDARRAFLLELDRVVLWFRLEESEKKTKTPESEINKIVTKITEDLIISGSWKKEFIRKTQENFKTDEMIEGLTGHAAFFKTLKSKSLRNRLDKYEEKQRKLAFNLRELLEKAIREKKEANNGQTKRRSLNEK